MAESDGHKFLSQLAVGFLERAASTRLYTFLENDRRRFDFGCCLMRDWTRPIVGQTLWGHGAGVDKDLRTMLADPDAEVCIYLARDSVQARNTWLDGVNDFRRGFPNAGLYRLRPVWVPHDFDVDSESQRRLVADLVESQLSSDVLLNIVLGNLNPESVRLFISSTGRVGLDLAILCEIATTGFVNLPRLASRLDTSRSSLPERLTRLTGCGFLTQPSPDASFYYVSLRGRVFLELCRELYAGRTTGGETKRILTLLHLMDDESPASRYQALSLRIAAAVNEFGVDLDVLNYHHHWQSDAWPPDIPRPQGFHDS